MDKMVYSVRWYNRFYSLMVVMVALNYNTTTYASESIVNGLLKLCTLCFLIMGSYRLHLNFYIMVRVILVSRSIALLTNNPESEPVTLKY
jgi:hypothetical protein